MGFLKSTSSYTVKKGTFIPQSVREKNAAQKKPLFLHTKKRLALPAKPHYLALPVGVLMLIVGFFAIDSLPAQSLPATPVVVITTEEPYQHTTLSFGSEAALSDHQTFKKASQAFIENQTSFLALDGTEQTISLYQEGALVFETAVEKVPSAHSWFLAPSGLYRVTSKEEKSYDAVNKTYYTNVVRFDKNFLIHGTVETAAGEVIEEPTRAGSKLSDAAAADLLVLAGNDLPVLVHTPRTNHNDSFGYQLNGPRVAARSFLAADVDSDITLFSRDETTVVPIASLTKLMTVVVAAEEYDLSSRIKVSQERYVTTLVPRLQGKYEANLFSLLQLLMVESSNEAAEVIASHMGRDAFIAKMNEKAAALGMSDTVFTDPSGLDNTNVSSASDLLILTRYISERHPFVWSVSMGEVEEFTPSEEFLHLDNFNEVDDLDNIVGGKIGETEAARQTSVSIHTYTLNGEERRVAIIVLGTEARNDNVKIVDRFIRQQYAVE
jgi:D-alanyl-D-alanine carboxypeptidase